MGTLTYLQMVDRLARRITQTAVTDVTTVTGQALMISEMVNEAQSSLSLDENWYTLYADRTFNTVAATATVAVASDFARTIDIVDTTNNRRLIEVSIKEIDMMDRGLDTQGTPTHFALVGSAYRFYRIPSSATAMKERYWKKPTVMTADGDTSSLPEFCDNLIMYWVEKEIYRYLNKFENADRAERSFLLEDVRCKKANRRIINKLRVFTPAGGLESPGLPRLPMSYPIG